MTLRAAWIGLIIAGAVACKRDAPAGRPRVNEADLSPAARDAETLGREIFAMMDRAIDYRGSHRGRPASSFAQMGIDSLTPTLVRRVINVSREPVVTVAFRQPDGHEIVSCRGDSSILEAAAVGGGQFTIMCTTSSGAQHPIAVGASSAGAASQS